jgi:hypothetical protein
MHANLKAAARAGLLYEFLIDRAPIARLAAENMTRSLR